MHSLAVALGGFLGSVSLPIFAVGVRLEDRKLFNLGYAGMALAVLIMWPKQAVHF